MDSFRRKLDNLPGTLKSQPVDSRTFDDKVVPGSDIWRRNGTTPYLGLQARLSQVWFNRWTVLLLLVLVRVLLLIGSLNDDLGDAKIKALSACTKVEDIGSAMASMPHYLSVGVNRLAASGITDIVHGMMKVLDMILTAVQELILFVINMMTSTYTCLIAAAVHGGLNVTALVVTKSTDAINGVFPAVADDIGSITDGVQKAIDEAWSWIDDLSGLFGAKPNKPSLDLSSDLDKIKSFKIDSSGFVSDLDKLNDDLPTFKEVQNFTATAVAFPFNLVKQALNDTYGDWEFDDSIFPVAQKEALSFCSDNSSLSDFFENLFELVAKAKIAFIVVLIILAIVVCVPMAWWEIRSWRRLKDYRNNFVQRKFDDTDMMMMSSRPFPSKIALKVSDWLTGNKDHKPHADPNSPQQKRETLVRWAVAYGTTLPALFVLSLAIAGFFSCLCQYIILAEIEKEVPALADQVGDFAGEVVTSLQRVSEDWANDANGVMTHYSDEINNDVLGYVVNATDAVNDTLNTFTSEMDKALTTAFNGTVLMDPIKEVVYCLIGLKVESVQKGLTWVHDHAHVTFPMFPNDTFSSGAAKSIDGDSDLTTFLSSPSSVSTDEVTGAVTHVTNAIHNNIIQEALISTGLLLVYVLVVLIGVMRMLVGMAGLGYETKGGPAEATTPTLAKRPTSTMRSSSEASLDRRKLNYGEKDGSIELKDNPFGSGSFEAGGAPPPRTSNLPSYYQNQRQ
ncbi:putative Plasma membrane fusion protein PRM1 [Seiridium unicorne]|uniref:Plasma membrane fusion protein PRM1 n=1 Tax=Seiridium unicorne TaxID=138068 RepID=A0ABR2VHF5_9PEZI